jgi:hypothetical protein
MVVSRNATLTFGCLLLVSCNNPINSTSGSMTVYLRTGTEAELSQCAGSLESTKTETYTGSDGSQWTWLTGETGTLSHYCRKDRGGNISAWREASRNEGATHSVKFDSNDSPAIFQPIEPK